MRSKRNQIILCVMFNALGTLVTAQADTINLSICINLRHAQCAATQELSEDVCEHTIDLFSLINSYGGLPTPDHSFKRATTHDLIRVADLKTAAWHYAKQKFESLSLVKLKIEVTKEMPNMVTLLPDDYVIKLPEDANLIHVKFIPRH